MYHGDFYMGWKRSTLQRVVDECNCNPYGGLSCCVEKGILNLQKNKCSITTQIDEDGTLALQTTDNIDWSLTSLSLPLRSLRQAVQAARKQPRQAQR